MDNLNEHNSFILMNSFSPINIGMFKYENTPGLCIG